MGKLSLEEIKENKALSPTFCSLPWLHLATKTWGGVAPCCVAEPLNENLNKTTFSLAWNSPSMKKLRKGMLEGKESPLCARCYEEERAGIASHRIRSNDYWRERYSFARFARETGLSGAFSGKAVYLDLRPGNKCNLECSMCGPQEAVRWESLSKKIYKGAKTLRLKKHFIIQRALMKFAPSKQWHEREEVKRDIYKQIPYLKRVTIGGGEPLLIKEMDAFLDECLRQNEAHHISLHYHTNGTVLRRDLFDKWRRFESAVIFISLDDLKERNHYIRYPCPWEKLERNIDLLDKEAPPNTHFRFLCALQIKNIFYFDRLLAYLMEKNFKKAACEDFALTGLVHQPYFLSCRLLPQKAKRIVSQKFEDLRAKLPLQAHRLKGIVDFMNEKGQSALLYVFKDYIQALDKARGTDFAKTFPELAELLGL